MYKRNLVSIIVPTHNRVDMLGRALESIKGQTYAEWEAIIVVNSCNDNTNNVVKEYLQDERFKFIDVPQPIGVQKARNMGIQRAKGEYIS
ncbi:MAG: glycosyltransferase family 2 protein, partial [Thermodesulfobacteriota bacterium]